jgi:hypothetical protein
MTPIELRCDRCESHDVRACPRQDTLQAGFCFRPKVCGALPRRRYAAGVARLQISAR